MGKKTKTTHIDVIETTTEISKPSALFSKLKKFKPLNKSQFEVEKLINTKDIVFIDGIAGSGKTYSALSIALNLIKDKSNNYETVILSKSVVQIDGEQTGFLPGTLEEKLEPVMYSYTANINKIFNSKTASDSLLHSGLIEWRPVTFLRGCQFDNAIVLLDEAQNMNTHCIKTLITRLGKSSKLIIMGDSEQYDRKNKEQSGFDTIKQILKDCAFVGNVEFKESECLRNPIITDIIKKLNQHDI